MTDSGGFAEELDLAGFVGQVEARRSALVAEIGALTAERADVNERVKAKRQELVRVERMWRSTQPRKSR